MQGGIAGSGRSAPGGGSSAQAVIAVAPTTVDTPGGGQMVAHRADAAQARTITGTSQYGRP